MERQNNTLTNNTNTTQEELEDEVYFERNQTGAFALYAFLSFLIVAANGLVLLLIWRRRRLRTTSNLMLTSLAFSDLLTGLLAVPMVIACSAAIKREVCITMEILNRFLAFSSVGHLTLLSLDRYLRVTKMLRYPTIVTEERLRWALATVWTTALFLSTVQLAWILSPLEENTVTRFDLGYVIFSFATLVVVPLFLMVAIYTKIFVQLRRHANEIHSEVSDESSSTRVNAGRRKLNEKKIASLFISMIAVFIFGLSFYFLWAIMDDLEALHGFSIIPMEVMQTLVIWIIFFRFLTALCNPILCTFIKQDFLDALRSFGQGIRDSIRESSQRASQRV